MERGWEDSLKHHLTAAEAAFCPHRRRRGRAADMAPLALLEPPGELARAWAARKRQLRDAALAGQIGSRMARPKLNGSPKDTSTAAIGFEAKLWLTADKLRNKQLLKISSPTRCPCSGKSSARGPRARPRAKV